jgi:hypothetical protein
VVTQPTCKRGTGNPQDLTAEGRVRETGPPRGLYASVGASQLCAPTFYPFLGASQFCAPTNYPFFQLFAGDAHSDLRAASSGPFAAASSATVIPDAARPGVAPLARGILESGGGFPSDEPGHVELGADVSPCRRPCQQLPVRRSRARVSAQGRRQPSGTSRVDEKRVHSLFEVARKSPPMNRALLRSAPDRSAPSTSTRPKAALLKRASRRQARRKSVPPTNTTRSKPRPGGSRRPVKCRAAPPR